MKKSTLSLTAIAVLTSVVQGNTTSAAIATATNLKIQSVTGALSGLKNNGYVVTNAKDELKATAKGSTQVNGPKAPREGSAMAKGLAIVEKMKGKPSADILAKLQSDAGLTVAGARTYLSTLNKRLGFNTKKEATEPAPAATVAGAEVAAQ